MHEPENYEKLKPRNFQEDVATHILNPLLERMNLKNLRNQKILDFGCGTGRVASEYLVPQAEETDSEIVGLDISQEMISSAKLNYSGDRLRFRCGDIRSKDFEFENDFDQIISIFVLHFIKDYKTALNSLFQILKPGGQAGFVVIATSDHYPCLKMIGEDPKWSSYMKGYEEFYPSWLEYKENPTENCKLSIERAAKEVGFEILDSRLQKFEYAKLESFDLYIEFRNAINPLIQNVPKELEFHASLATHLCQHLGIPDTPATHQSPFGDDAFKILTIVLRKPISNPNLIIVN